MILYKLLWQRVFQHNSLCSCHCHISVCYFEVVSSSYQLHLLCLNRIMCCRTCHSYAVACSDLTRYWQVQGCGGVRRDGYIIGCHHTVSCCPAALNGSVNRIVASLRLCEITANSRLQDKVLIARLCLVRLDQACRPSS